MEHYVKNYTDYINKNFYQSRDGDAVTSVPNIDSTDDGSGETPSDITLLKQGQNPGVVLGSISNSSKKNGTRSSTRSSKVCTSRGSFGMCVNNTRVAQDCVEKSLTRSLICGRSQTCCMDSNHSDRVPQISTSMSVQKLSVKERPATSMFKS